MLLEKVSSQTGGATGVGGGIGAIAAEAKVCAVAVRAFTGPGEESLVGYLRSGFAKKLGQLIGPVNATDIAHHVTPIGMAQEVLLRWGSCFKGGVESMIKHLPSAQNGMWVPGSLHKQKRLHDHYTALLRRWIQENATGTFAQFENYARRKAIEIFR